MTCTNFPSAGLVIGVTTHQVGEVIYLWSGVVWEAIAPPLELANDLSQAYSFPTKQDLIDSVIVFPVGKELHVILQGGTYTVVAGASPYPIGSPDLVGGGYALLQEVNSKISLTAYGAIFGSLAAATTNVNLMVEYRAFCDASDYCGLIDADGRTLHINAEIFIPKFFMGTGDAQTGQPVSISGGDVTYRYNTHGVGGGLYIDGNFKVQAGQFHDISNIRIHPVNDGKFILDGFDPGVGLFWCKFTDIRAVLFFDLATFAVNQNQFINCNPFGETDQFSIEISDNGNVGTKRECHMNQFIGCDMSRSKGAVNNSELNQLNFIMGGYGEAMTAPLVADGSNFNVQNLNLDDNGTYIGGIHNTQSGTTEQIERSGGEYYPITLENHALGGCWDVLSSTGVPVSFSGTGSATFFADAPYGSFKMYGETTTVDFRGVNVTIPPILNGSKFSNRVTLTAIWKGDKPASIELGASSYSVDRSVASLGGDYYLIRISGYASDTIDTVLKVFRTTTGGASRTGFLGNVFVAQGKIAPLPKSPTLAETKDLSYISKGGLLKQQSIIASGYSASSPSTVSIVFPVPYKAGEIPVMSLTAEALNVASSTRTVGIQAYLVTNLGFDAIITHTSDYTGVVHWSAEGVASKV